MGERGVKISKKLIESWKDKNSGYHSINRKIKLSNATRKNFASGTKLRENQIDNVKNKWKDPNSKYNSLDYRQKLKDNSGKRYVIKVPNESDIICQYGCGQKAKYKFNKINKYCCEENWQSCPNKRKESKKLIEKELSNPDSWFHSKICSDSRRNFMLRGGALHAMMGVNKISKPQLELFKLISKICPYVVLEYPCINYKIDIAVPKLNLAIEYDGSYYHQDKVYDKLRQNRLEEEGWLFLRYEDYIPSKKEVLYDIRQITENK